MLNEGDKIDISGGLPLKPGIYWVAYVSYCHGQPYYGLRKFYGRTITGRFFANTIDALMAQGLLVAA